MTQKMTQNDAPKKFLATLRVIVEADDWNEAFDFLDELTKAEIAATDAKVLASSIDYLRQTRLGLGSRSSKRDLKEAGMTHE